MIIAFAVVLVLLALSIFGLITLYRLERRWKKEAEDAVKYNNTVIKEKAESERLKDSINTGNNSTDFRNSLDILQDCSERK